MTGDEAGNLWLSGNKGLARLNGSRFVENIPWAALGHRQQAKVIVADRGGVWLSFWQDGGVMFFKDGKIEATCTSAQGLGAGHVAGLRLDADGAVWAATEDGGLSRIKDGRVTTLTVANGLPCDTIHWSTPDDTGSLWMCTACGLVRVVRDDLAAWIADPSRRVAPKLWAGAYRRAAGPAMDRTGRRRRLSDGVAAAARPRAPGRLNRLGDLPIDKRRGCRTAHRLRRSPDAIPADRLRDAPAWVRANSSALALAPITMEVVPSRAGAPGARPQEPDFSFASMRRCTSLTSDESSGRSPYMSNSRTAIKPIENGPGLGWRGKPSSNWRHQSSWRSMLTAGANDRAASGRISRSASSINCSSGIAIAP